jgi:hypothetical protein
MLARDQQFDLDAIFNAVERRRKAMNGNHSGRESCDGVATAVENRTFLAPLSTQSLFRGRICTPYERTLFREHAPEWINY